MRVAGLSSRQRQKARLRGVHNMDQTLIDLYKFDVRAQRVLDVCRSGGRIRYALETGFRGREQFQFRVLDKNRAVVKGLGYKAAKACIVRGLVKSEPCAKSSAWPQEWVIA